MKQKLRDDLKAAMKARERLRTMTIRGILSEVTRVEKDVCRAASDAEVVQVIKRERARREEALEFARQAKRDDLIAQYQGEAVILDGYLPSAVGPDELEAAIAHEIESGTAQMGAVMKALKERFGPRLDGKAASEAVKRALAAK